MSFLSFSGLWNDSRMYTLSLGLSIIFSMCRIVSTMGLRMRATWVYLSVLSAKKGRRTNEHQGVGHVVVAQVDHVGADPRPLLQPVQNPSLG